LRGATRNKQSIRCRSDCRKHTHTRTHTAIRLHKMQTHGQLDTHNVTRATIATPRNAHSAAPGRDRLHVSFSMAFFATRPSRAPPRTHTITRVALYHAFSRSPRNELPQFFVFQGKIISKGEKSKRKK
jgi:hypothetical protein